MHAIEGRFIAEVSFVEGIDVAYVEFDSLCAVGATQDDGRHLHVLAATAHALDAGGVVHRRSADSVFWPFGGAFSDRRGASGSFAVTQFG